MADVSTRRAYQVYLYVVCFVSVLILVFAGARALFGVVRIALPDQTAAAHGYYGEPYPAEVVGAEFDPVRFERRRGIAQLLENGILAGLAFALFAFHWRRAGQVRAELEGGSGGSDEKGDRV